MAAASMFPRSSIASTPPFRAIQNLPSSVITILFFAAPNFSKMSRGFFTGRQRDKLLVLPSVCELITNVQ